MLAEAIEELGPEFQADPVTVVPVPLHRTKLRQRGFNQAELIARAAVKVRPAQERLLCARMFSRESAKQRRKLALPCTSAARICVVLSQCLSLNW